MAMPAAVGGVHVHLYIWTCCTSKSDGLGLSPFNLLLLVLGTRCTELFRRVPGNHPLNLQECLKPQRSTLRTQGLPELGALRLSLLVRPGTPDRPASMSLQHLAPHLCIARCSFVCIPKDEHAPPEEVQAQRQQPSQQGPQAQVEGAALQVQLAPHVLLNQVVPGLPISIQPLGLHNGSTVGTSGLRLALVSARSAGCLV